MGVSDDFLRPTSAEVDDRRTKNGTLRVVLCSFFCFFCLASLIFKHAKFSKVNAF